MTEADRRRVSRRRPAKGPIFEPDRPEADQEADSSSPLDKGQAFTAEEPNVTAEPETSTSDRITAKAAAPEFAGQEPEQENESTVEYRRNYSSTEDHDSSLSGVDLKSIEDIEAKEKEKAAKSEDHEERRSKRVSMFRRAKETADEKEADSPHSVHASSATEKVTYGKLFPKKKHGTGEIVPVERELVQPSKIAPKSKNKLKYSRVTRTISRSSLVVPEDEVKPKGPVAMVVPDPPMALKYGLKLFRSYYAQREERYQKLEVNLRKSKMPYSAVQYMSLASFYTFVSVGVISALSVVFLILLGPIGIFGVLFGAVAVIMFAAIFFSLPSSTANRRKKDINNKIPMAISYIATMASADLPIDKIMRELGDSQEYGEISKEARSISMSSSLFGNDIITAMRDGAKNSPSPKFTEFLQGIVTTVTSGGNLKEYFKIKAVQYQEELNTIIKSNGESIGVLAESYVTVGVAFPLMLIVILGVVAALEASAGMTIVLYLIVLMIIPLITVSFAFMISSTIKEVNV